MDGGRRYVEGMKNDHFEYGNEDEANTCVFTSDEDIKNTERSFICLWIFRNSRENGRRRRCPEGKKCDGRRGKGAG